MPPTNRRELDSKRVLARLIDALLITIPVIVLMALDVIEGFGIWLVIAAVQLSYFFMLEATVGQTVGKQAMGLKVSRADGSPAGAAAVATRTVLRLLEDNLLGLIVMVLSGKRRQRIGDLLGGTVVTRAAAAPGLPSPSALVVVYPVLWVAAAGGYTLVAPEQDPYLAEVAAICKKRTDVQDRMPQLDITDVFRMSAKETQRIARLEPTPAFEIWHREVVREKREFDALGREFFEAAAASPDPEGTYYEFEARFTAEAKQHNDLFAEVGLEDCAR